MITKHDLPDHYKCTDLKEYHSDTPLSTFILENEPAGFEDSDTFRGQLADLVNYLNPHATKESILVLPK